MTLSVEIIENTNSSDSNIEEKFLEENKSGLDLPKQDSFHNDNSKSSGASFSFHSIDKTAKIPPSKVLNVFNAINRCTQADVIKSVIEPEPVKMIGNRFKDRKPSSDMLNLRKQVSSAVFTTIEPLKEYRERPDGPI